MKLFKFRRALATSGLALIVTLAAGCSAKQGLSTNPYGYSDYGSSYHSGYGSSYPYNSGYGSSYPNL